MALLVMTTTPLEPFEPYMAVALASFKRVMLSTWLSSKSMKRVREISKPSRMKSGWLAVRWLSALTCMSCTSVGRLEAPRTVMLGRLFGSEPMEMSSMMLKLGSRLRNMVPGSGCRLLPAPCG